MNISEFCKIYTGTGFPMDFQGKKNGKYPFYKVSDISVSNTQQKIFLGNANNYIDELELSILKGNIIPAGTIVFAKIGEALKLNKRAITSCKCLIDNNVIGIKPDENIINLLYFYYYLLKIDMLYYSESTTLPSVRKSTIEKIKVKIPPINVQNKRVTILNLCHKTIKYKMELLHNLELLVKSRFVELFGDIELNEKKWKKIKFDELIKSANNGLARRGNNKDGNIVLRLIELQENSINYSSPNRIFLTDDEKKRYRLLDGDLLFARVNGNPNNVGRCAPFYECEEQVYHNDHIIRTSCDKSQLDSVFAAYLFNSEYGKNRISKKIKTSAGQYTINQEGLKSIEIILPPIVIQYSFAKFVKQINKLKSDVQKSIDETQLLMDSLMQEYFG